MAELSYADVSAITYRADDIILRLTPEQQSFLVQAAAIFNDPAEWSDYATNGDDIDALVAASEYALQVDEVAALSQQSRTTLWHRWAQINTGNALQINMDASLMFGHYCRQNTAAVTDETNQDVWLSAGDYQIRVLYYRLTANGKASWTFQHQETLDQVTAITAFDLSGTTLANQVISASFTLTESGHYKMFIHVTAAGAAGGGFGVALIHTEVWKTADP